MLAQKPVMVPVVSPLNESPDAAFQVMAFASDVVFTIMMERPVHVLIGGRKMVTGPPLVSTIMVCEFGCG